MYLMLIYMPVSNVFVFIFDAHICAYVHVPDILVFIFDVHICAYV